jgi:acyl carrier protein
MAFEQNVRGLVAEFMAESEMTVEVASLASDLNLLQAGIIDSISFLGLVAFLEEKLAVEIDFLETDPSEMTNLDGLTAVLQRLVPGSTM